MPPSLKGKLGYITKVDYYKFEVYSFSTVCINLLLSLFGEYEIISDEELSYSTPTKVVYANWDILPKDKYPWIKVKKSIESISKKYNNTQKEMMLRNSEEINYILTL